MLKVLDCDADHAKGVAFNMLFVLWRGQTLEHAFRRCIVAAIELGRRYPEGIGISHCLDRAATRPDGNTRAAFVDLLRLGCIRHYSVTFDASGFKAAAIRGVISGTTSLARPAFPHAVHVSLAAAARWHAEQQAALGRRETAIEIERAALELRRSHYERFPTGPTERGAMARPGGRSSG